MLSLGPKASSWTWVKKAPGKSKGEKAPAALGGEEGGPISF